jgi:hypothetical protein
VTRLGIASPRTVVLPNREYVPGIKHDESLRNLVYPLPWQDIADYVGMPCVLKDAHGGGWKDVYVCHSLEELIRNYDQSGRLTMVVQEFIRWHHFVRCLCIGQEEILPIKYDPKERKYHVEHGHLSAELGERVVGDALKIVRALGYDMNSIEFAIRDDVPYAIDFMNPAPDMDVNSLTPHYFEWAVSRMADMAVRLAKSPAKQRRDLGWERLFGAGDAAVAVAVAGAVAGREAGGGRGAGAGAGKTKSVKKTAPATGSRPAPAKPAAHPAPAPATAPTPAASSSPSKKTKKKP